MNERANEINTIVKEIPAVNLIKPFEQKGEVISGNVSVWVNGLELPLEFDVIILPGYPLKREDSETIKFLNKDLLKYSHIMPDGTICIHPSHCPNLLQKLHYDFASVKEWINKYYINKNLDAHYEHLIVPSITIDGWNTSFLFNEVSYVFSPNEFGWIDYSLISNGQYYYEKITSSILQTFYSKKRQILSNVNWNFQLKHLPKKEGMFIFLGKAPSKNQRWVFNNWGELAFLLTDECLDFLHQVEQYTSKSKDKFLPLFIGYNIPNGEIHWQVIMLEIKNFPIYNDIINGKKRIVVKRSHEIFWSITKNCSYKYFFGRGRLSDKFTSSKILIIGVGAIGSIVAKTLVRSGCVKVGFLDYDVKEPENVCRSEYSFATGITNKTDDLINELCLVSPFFEPISGGYDYFKHVDYYMKSGLTDSNTKSNIEKHLNSYDIIIDCSADNDLLYVLTQLKLNAVLLNISISNHAQQLVCATEPNRYDFITTQFNGRVLKFDIDDLYNPTGCWSPTFKASYNDINMLVQTAIKHINLRFDQGRDLRNFVIETDTSDCLTINLKEF